jgi:hypothetical protein
MPDIDDDDFIRRYEGAVIIYDATFDGVVDRILRSFPDLPYTPTGQWTLTDATAIGGGFYRRINALYWLYPEGLAICVDPVVLQRGSCDAQMLREARHRFYAILERWRRNRY